MDEGFVEQPIEMAVQSTYVTKRIDSYKIHGISSICLSQLAGSNVKDLAAIIQKTGRSIYSLTPQSYYMLGIISRYLISLDLDVNQNAVVTASVLLCFLSYHYN